MIQDPLWCVHNLLSKVNRDLRTPMAYLLSLIIRTTEARISCILSMITDRINKGGFTFFAFLMVPDHKDNKSPTIRYKVYLNSN